MPKNPQTTSKIPKPLTNHQQKPAELQPLDSVALPGGPKVSFNSAISACEKGRRWRWALELFHQLDDADEVSYNAVPWSKWVVFLGLVINGLFEIG